MAKILFLVLHEMTYQINLLLVELWIVSYHLTHWLDFIWSFLGGPRKRVCRWYSSWIYSSQGRLVHVLPIFFLLYLVFSFFVVFVSSIITPLSSNILNSDCPSWKKNSSSKQAMHQFATFGCLRVSVCHAWVFECFSLSCLSVWVFQFVMFECLSVSVCHVWVFECFSLSCLSVCSLLVLSVKWLVESVYRAVLLLQLHLTPMIFNH